MTKSVYLEDKKYTEIAPPGIVKQMKDRGIITVQKFNTIFVQYANRQIQNLLI